MTTPNERAINAAVDWAIKIANDNSFHYGEDKWAHHSGCYFCGTNGKKSAKVKAGAKYEDQLKTYCCNPFVTAAFNHGAGAPGVDCKVASKRINLANDKNIPLQDTKEWKKITKPAKITSLQKGDILLTPTHVMLYIGNGKIVHAAGHDNGPKDVNKWNSSIRVETCPSKKWNATTKIYRYIGKGKFGGKNMFEVGKVYTLQEDMNLRSGAGTEYDILPVSKWTAGAREHATESGMLARGTRVTCQQVEVLPNGAVWIKIPSGWVCAIGSTGTEFVSEKTITPDKVENTKPSEPTPPTIDDDNTMDDAPSVNEPVVDEPEVDDDVVDDEEESYPIEDDDDDELVDIPTNGGFDINNFTDKNSVIRMLVSVIASVNLIITAFGGEAISVSDNLLYIIGSVVAFVVTVGIAIYKNNATSRFGMLCKKIKKYVVRYGIEDIYRVVMNALHENFDTSFDDNPEDDEVLPQ